MSEKKTTVTLEDLLRVKRAERPPPEFWAQFERELRVKQLAAIVEPRPWWASFIKFGARLHHYQLPIGAAAVLALSFVTIGEYRTAGVAPDFSVDRAASASTATLGSERSPSRELASVAAPSAGQIEAAAVLPAVDVSPDATATGRVAHAVPLLAAPTPVIEPTPSARYIAANLAAAQAANPGIMDEVFGMAVRSMETREPVRDPLAQISAPGESRRSRLLASALPASATSEVSVGTSDRVARRLTEDRLYDTISRVGLKGDRVAIKF